VQAQRALALLSLLQSRLQPGGGTIQQRLHSVRRALGQRILVLTQAVQCKSLGMQPLMDVSAAQ
jgi:hypothetical protein